MLQEYISEETAKKARLKWPLKPSHSINLKNNQMDVYASHIFTSHYLKGPNCINIFIVEQSRKSKDKRYSSDRIHRDWYIGHFKGLPPSTERENAIYFDRAHLIVAKRNKVQAKNLNEKLHKTVEDILNSKTYMGTYLGI
jgi:hypothetical protein